MSDCNRQWKECHARANEAVARCAKVATSVVAGCATICGVICAVPPAMVACADCVVDCLAVTVGAAAGCVGGLIIDYGICEAQYIYCRLRP